MQSVASAPTAMFVAGGGHVHVQSWNVLKSGSLHVCPSVSHKLFGDDCVCAHVGQVSMHSLSSQSAVGETSWGVPFIGGVHSQDQSFSEVGAVFGSLQMNPESRHFTASGSVTHSPGYSQSAGFINADKFAIAGGTTQ
ncbi:hypothetical protein DIPPA_07903 [Diplonema papillatum]|nr:hypothetical protein DIPPA_07903 [Diplonema papillatum]